MLDTGDGFTHTFSHSGTYTYFCSLHPRMTASVVVR
ncbi:MAG: plastocyanin/azurin family copper-binding protein [Candidatus Angelobacter sp.]